MAAPVVSAKDWAWQRQSVWSQTANKLKTGPSRMRTAMLILTVAAAALALAGSQAMSVSFPASLALSVTAAVALAGVGLLRRLVARRTAADGRALSGPELMAECEQVISVQNQAWMAKWGDENSPAGQGG